MPAWYAVRVARALKIRRSRPRCLHRPTGFSLSEPTSSRKARPAGDQSTTECTEPEYPRRCRCLSEQQQGVRLSNQFSPVRIRYGKPDRGHLCRRVSEACNACLIVDPCVLAGGVCDTDTCVGGLEDGLACAPPTEGECEMGGGICEQSDQFRLFVQPDVKNLGQPIS